LDPCTKSGVFLREIASRLTVGLETEIPDLEERVTHILTKQVFGIGITTLTSLLARRSVYCSKNANGEHSIAKGFNRDTGNIYYRRLEHSWQDSKCVFCGASKMLFERDATQESHAYPFIHTSNIKRSIKSFFGEEMHFDVVIGNPPYQLSDGGAQSSAIPIYQHFVTQAKNLQPQYIAMIIPSRWFTGGKGLEDFRNEMLHDQQIREIHDFYDARDCFPNVEIKGGVCYFLWKQGSKGKCKVSSYSHGEVDSVERPLLEDGVEVFIRYNGAIRVIKKVLSLKEPTMADSISARKPFGLSTDFKDFQQEKFKGSIKIFANKRTGYVKKELIKKNVEWIGKHKVIAPYAFGSGDSKSDVLKPLYAPPDSCCTETYLVLGAFATETEAKNLISYISTRFFRFLLTQVKNTQHATSRVYVFVPLQDFVTEWTDERLYEKYKLSSSEIAVIESTT
jgi:site-specific DNA-methyltransferase (adenine-specific)